MMNFVRAFWRALFLRRKKAGADAPDHALSNEGPPDLDELFTNFIRRVRGKKNSAPLTPEPEKSSPNYAALSRFLLPVVLVLVVLWVAYKSVYIVNQTDRGVVFFLGKYTGDFAQEHKPLVYDEKGNLANDQGAIETRASSENRSGILLPGLHFLLWPLYTVEKVNVATLREARVQGRMLTSDENIIEAFVRIQYRIISPEKYVLNLVSPRQTTTNALTSSLRHTVGSSEMVDALTTGRGRVADEVAQRLQTYLNHYSSGIQVVKVTLQGSKPPSEVQDAFDDVNRSREDAARSINEAKTYANRVIPQARGEAARIVAAAEAYAAGLIAEAGGEAERFLRVSKIFKQFPALLTTRLKEELKRKIYERTTKVIVDPSVKNFIYLPLDKLIDRHKTPQEDDQSALSKTMAPLSKEGETPSPNNPLSSRARSARP